MLNVLRFILFGNLTRKAESDRERVRSHETKIGKYQRLKVKYSKWARLMLNIVL